MPGYLLHAGATVICAHGGQAMPTQPNPRVRVSGQPIVTQPPLYTLAGCPFVSGTNPLPCLTASWMVAAMRVKAGGTPVLLQDSQAITVPNGVPLTVLVTQVRVKGM